MLKLFATFLRLLRTGWVLIRHAISRIFAFGNRKGNAGERFANALEDLGPAYIKFGQILS